MCRWLESIGDKGREEGLSLVEVLLAAGLLITALVAIAQLFVQATGVSVSLRRSATASVLAEQKVEELRAMPWGALSPSPPGTLQANTAGFVDHLGLSGRVVGRTTEAPTDAIYTRRWSIAPSQTDPGNSVVLQVSVISARAGPAGAGDTWTPERVRLITLRTKKAP